MIHMASTSILEDVNKIVALDSANLLSGITALPEQLEDTWQAVSKIVVNNPDSIKNIVVAGMGGSGLGADIAISSLSDQLLKPVQVVHGYQLPNYISADTLVVLASFSGTTEEILACHQQATAAGTQQAIISASGPLLETAKKLGYSYYQIEATYNRSQQQRMALGYALLGIIGVLRQAGALKLETSDLQPVIQAVKEVVIACGVENEVENNPAKHLAYEIIDRQPVLIGAEFMEGALHTATNQLNENGKIFADYKVIPEMNHHLLEGLKYPVSNAHHHFFVFIESDLYLPANQHRLTLTQKIVEDLDIPNLTIHLKAPTKLAQVFELITTWSFASIYLAVLEGFDPGPLPVVDAFKSDLKQLQSA